ncbi:MAG: ribosome small subunit-dependent GTPase A [Treponema sp.]|jgi:ribosome biogenesis GTPase|nr:ribosome small subunit-dependent GTPase A [Treponema sp.]
MRGLVFRGSRNLFTVRAEEPGGLGPELECRIKGKVLKGREGYYNPLAPGDWVTLEAGPDGTARILAAGEWRNLLTRFNQKGQKPQILAANLDLLLCVTSPLSPPFRPRFLDRVLVQAEAAGIPAAILCNKYDLAPSPENRGAPAEQGVEERLGDYRRAGYRVLRVSAKTGWGLDELRALGAGKTTALLGQSGVGKSSLIRALAPGLTIKTGAMNEKYDRGTHTTTLSVMREIGIPPVPGGPEIPSRIIDTPGIRRMVPDGVKPEDLILYMREFAPLAGRCAYGLSCSHRGEPGCRITEALAAGTIHEDRYESFLRIGDELAAL